MIVSEVSFWQLIADQFYKTTWLEWFGTITGFICIYLAAKEHILNWPIAILSSLAYAVLFFDYHLYGDSVLQFYFIGTAVYGWHYWIKRKSEDDKPVVSLKIKGLFIVVFAVFVLSVIAGFILDQYTDTNVPYIDGFCTAASLVAQVLLTRKILQNWALWIVVDSCYIPLYIYKDLYLTAALYTLFLVLAAMGYSGWKKTYDLSQSKL